MRWLMEHPWLTCAPSSSSPTCSAAPGVAARAAGAYPGGPRRWRRRARRVLFLGMGSSRFAALDAAARPARARDRRARRDGLDRHARSRRPPTRSSIAISATGGSAETLAAMRRHLGTSIGRGRDQPAGERDRPRGRRVPRDRRATGRAASPAPATEPTLALLHVLRPLAPAPRDPRRAAEASAALLARPRTPGSPRAVELLEGGADPRARAGRADRVGRAVGADAARGAAGAPPTPARPATGRTSTST